MRSGAHGGLMCPLEKGVRGIGTSGSGYLRQQIRGGRKGRAERQGLGQSPNKTTRLGGLNKASSDAGPELAGRAAFAGIARAAARSPREDQALLLRRRLPLVPRAASPHGGNLAASHM